MAVLLLNREVLAVNQDPLGKPARRAVCCGSCETRKKPPADGSLAVAQINRGSTGNDVVLKASDIGLLDSPKLARNLWMQEDIADFTQEIARRVQPQETILLKIGDK